LNLSADEKEIMLMKIISEDFIKRLLVLSANWQQPQMPVRLSLRFVRKMDEERSKRAEGKDVSVKHWMRYYQIRGLGWDSPDYVLPPSREEIEKRWAAIQTWPLDQKWPLPEMTPDEHLTEAMWPIIRSGRKPLELRIRQTIAGWVFYSEEKLWYSALVHVFLDWHEFVIGRYGDDTSRLLQEVKRRAQELQDPKIRAEICRGIEDEDSMYVAQLKMKQRVTRLRKYGPSMRSSMNWWLSAQGIHIDEYDLRMLRDGIGGFDHSLNVHWEHISDEEERNLWIDD
jgi:hypothetical protein